MAGDIFFGFDKNAPEGQSSYNDGYVSSDFFEAFKMALHAALEDDFPSQLEIILEAQYMGIISFIDLDDVSFNKIIKCLRHYFSKDTDRPPFFAHAKWVWVDMAEPFITKDQRYDFLFHAGGL
jgi:hypothetical protein